MSTDGRVTLQPAYVLHRKPYRDTSLLVEAFTRDFGRIGLVARGARGRRSSSQALLQPFQALWLSWGGRGELHSLSSVEAAERPLNLTGDAVLSGFYLNELLLRLLPRDDPHELLYGAYRQTLMNLSEQGADEWGLRLFERDLLQELGYGLQLTHDSVSQEPLRPDCRYCYHPEFGPQYTPTVTADCLAVMGGTLLALDSGSSTGEQCLREAKQLMRMTLQRYLGERPLASRELFKARYAYTKKPNTTDDAKE